jgi:hypothetical protein
MISAAVTAGAGYAMAYLGSTQPPQAWQQLSKNTTYMATKPKEE